MYVCTMYARDGCTMVHRRLCTMMTRCIHGGARCTMVHDAWCTIGARCMYARLVHGGACAMVHHRAICTMTRCMHDCARWCSVHGARPVQRRTAAVLSWYECYFDWSIWHREDPADHSNPIRMVVFQSIPLKNLKLINTTVYQ